MKKFPIGIQTFRDLIQGEYLYIDKTEQLYNLMMDGGKYYFISRPRRFGKSLMISTLNEIFSGNKDLFEGLWIHDRIDWPPYPVIHLDFTLLNYQTSERLEESLGRLLDDIAASYGIQLDQDRYYNEKFKQLIDKLASAHNGKVVVLVDEYDKPIIDKIEIEHQAMVHRDILNGFYAIIKAMDRYIHFALITGVSKFSRVSVFSGLNNLRDITLSEDFSSIMGYTQEELTHYFHPHIDTLAKKLHLQEKELYANIKTWYNGYSWDGKNFLYNPHSILNLFKEQKFDNYWFTSATPTFLVKLIRATQFPFESFDRYETDHSVFESFDVDRINIASLLFQSGYLTIKEILPVSVTSRMYYFSYPNAEVKESFIKHLLSQFSGKLPNEVGSLAFQINRHIQAGDIEGFVNIVKSLFASIPYNIFETANESYYHSLMYLILTLAGINIQAEVQTNIGRTDAIIETNDTIYIVEFKIGTAQAALNQIEEKKYFEKHLSSPKTIKLLGIGFDPTLRNIGDHKLKAHPNT